MLKTNLKLAGNQKLSRNELKKVTGGGIIPPGCSISCTHRLPNGPIQFGCPSYEECVP
ncbi:bacteriocin-like protein [Pedobacter steynii]|uniref:bacteriocin-like protein n=1 Tax=Pedobacter steynii TaxID=430522 RepID=UPI0026911141